MSQLIDLEHSLQLHIPNLADTFDGVVKVLAKVIND